jgi:PAS domain S-box-containing protein
MNRTLNLSKEELIVLNENLEKRVKALEEKVLKFKNIEEGLRESEARFKQLADSTYEGIVFHENGTILDINQQMCTMIGYSVDELLGRNVLELMVIEKRKEAIQSIRSGLQMAYDTILRKKNGDLLEVEILSRPFMYRGRKVKVAAIRDLTYRKRFEKTIEESEIKFKQLAENTSDAIVLQNDYTVLYWNPAFERIFGISGANVPQKPNFFVEFIHPNDKGYFESLISNDQFKKERKFEAQYRVIRPDGTIIWVWNRCFPIFNRQGELMRQIMMISDISHHRKAEDRERTYNSNLVFLSNTALKFLSFSNDDDIFIFIGKKLAELTRNSIILVLSFNETDNTLSVRFISGINRNLDDILQILERNPEEIKLRVNRVFLKNVLSHEQNLYPVAGGLYQATQGHISIDNCKKIEQLLNIGQFYAMGLMRGGNLYGAVLVGTKTNNEIKDQKIIETFLYQASISLHRKQLENELIRAKEKAEESDRLKSSFLANMSHEIRTPMNGILGMTQLLAIPDISNENRVEYVELINKNSETLLNLIDDIIDVSKIEAGQMKIIRKSFRLNSLLDQLQGLFTSSPVFKSKANLELIATRNLPDNLSIYSDPDRVRQIFINLIGNAIKFTESGQVEFGYQLKEKVLEFYVKDTGIGISKEKQKLVFERFTQADDSLTRKFGGSGLGLAISRGLIELLGGHIWMSSELHKGSTFYFTIPYIPTFDDENLPKPIEELRTDFDWKHRSFLIVEDDKVSYKFLEGVFRKTGAKIFHAENGLRAIEYCRTKPEIDMVLMDIQLPEMSGLDATRIIKALRKDLPIIAQTANAMSEDKERCLEVGCVDYVSKPINIGILFNKIDKYLPKN